MSMQLPQTVVIVGRMNVGKSTLFNRIVKSGSALVSPVAGTTRDWQEAITEWRGRRLRMIDTGGVESQNHRITKSKNHIATIQEAVERATERAIAKADVMLFVVDAKEGMMPQDRSLARLILHTQKPIILAVNKVDSPYHRSHTSLFWKLGCGEPHPIAALTGAGVGDLLDVITKSQNHKIIESHNHRNKETPETSLPENPHLLPLAKGERAPLEMESLTGREGVWVRSENKEQPLRIAVIGKPNVGKSSLVNAILGEERVIVSPVAGTTREPIDTDFERDGKQYTLVDTAGIRRRAERTRTLEAAGVERTLAVLRRADIAFLVLESNEPLASQDLRIAGALVDNTVGVVIVANKWDLFHRITESQNHRITASHDVIKKYTSYLRGQMPHIAWAPIIFIAAKTGHNVHKILATAEATKREREKMIPEATLAAWLKRLTYRPHKRKGKVRTPHIYGIKQISIKPPTFELVTEFKVVPTKRGMQKETVRDSYVRFLENQLRASFGFTGTPIVVKIRTIE